MSKVSDPRLELAYRLREMADKSSEAELRSSLSRSYYSILHVANVFLRKKVSHHNIVEELSKLDIEKGSSVEILQKLRQQADYDPSFVEREFGGDIELFRVEVQRKVEDGRAVFRWMTDNLSNDNG
jgi:hypothetical protein